MNTGDTQNQGGGGPTIHQAENPNSHIPRE